MPLSYTEPIKQVCNLERTIRVPYLTAVKLAGKSYCNSIFLADHFVGCGSVGMEQGDGGCQWLLFVLRERLDKI